MPRSPAVQEPASQDSAAQDSAAQDPAAAQEPASEQGLSAAARPAGKPASVARRRPARPAADAGAAAPAPAAPAPHDPPAHGAADALPLGTALRGTAQAARAALAIKDPVVAVHKLRRTLKEARALLALIEGGHRPAARRLRRDLGAAARSLASTRDRHIVHDALADLAAHPKRHPLAASLGRKIANALSPRQASDTGAEEGLGMLRRAGLAEQIAGGAELADDVRTEALPEVLAESYRRARRAARGIDRGNAVALHELRKQIVAHVSHMELAAGWWPKLGEFWRDELQDLREALGRHHDLEILLERLDGASDRLPAGEIATAMHAASRRQRKLADKALRRHALLFAERPKAFRRRLAAYLAANMDHAKDRE